VGLATHLKARAALLFLGFFAGAILVPVAFAVTVPAQAVTSRLQWQTFALAVVFAAVLFAFTRWFWRVGLRRYSGASA